MDKPVLTSISITCLSAPPHAILPLSCDLDENQVTLISHTHIDRIVDLRYKTYASASRTSCPGPL